MPKLCLAFGVSVLVALLLCGCKSTEPTRVAAARMSSAPSYASSLMAERVAHTPSANDASSTTTAIREFDVSSPEERSDLPTRRASSIAQASFSKRSQEPQDRPVGNAIPPVIEAVDPPAKPEGSPSQEFDVTLNQAVFASLNGHPVIGAELERIQLARGDYLTSTLFPNPQLFTDVQLLPLTRPFTVNAQGGPPQQDVILTYPIDWFLFGKRAAAISREHYGVHIAQAEFENMIRLRVVITATAFFDALEAEGLLDVAKQNVENLHRLEAVTKQAIADGGRPAIEANRIRLDAIASEQRLRTAVAADRSAIARLRALMGGEQVPLLLSPRGELELTATSPALDVPGAMEIAKQARPDLQAILWRRTRSEADIVVQQRLARPQVAPSFGYTRQYQQKAIGYPDADSWSAALSVSLPLYDRNQGNIAKAGAEERRNRFEYAAALLDVEAEITQAIAELKAAEENARSVATEQLKLAENVRDSITEAFQNGGRPLIDVLDSQRNYRETYALYVSSRAEYWRALYRYYAAIGQRVNNDE